MSVKLIAHGGKGGYHVVLRTSLGKLVPEGARFEPELTDEGILLRFIGFADAVSPPPDVPKWARNGDAA